MNYTQFLVWLTTVLQVSDPSGVAALTNIIPMIIARAENLIYADPELDFLVTRDTDVSQSTATGSRAVAIPSNMIIVEGATIVTPANTLPSVPGAMRIPMLRTTRQFIDITWPMESETAAPSALDGIYYAIFDMEQAAPSQGEAAESVALPSAIMIAPTPDNSYRIEFTGVVTPQPLSSTNTKTFLTTYFPSLFIAASMVIAAAYQRDYGASSDDPKLALSWGAEFEMQKRVAISQSQRQKSQIGGFRSSHVAGPPPMSTLPAPGGGAA